MGAAKNKMPFIPQCLGLAQSAAAEMPGDGWPNKPTLFHWQSMRPHAELHQQLQPWNGHWNLKVWHSFPLAWAQKPRKICAELGPSRGSGRLGISDLHDEKPSGDMCTASRLGQGKSEGPRVQHQIGLRCI